MEALIWTAFITALYFLPTFVATSSRKASVFTINLFFGWTFIGWVIALFMAIRSKESVAS